ncbi:hypothetical protein MSPP1_001936 [Malassezia sp. CBS 17886]|nr:hypothetical protein MSPP1_001936 [Malassezia sp. CBS 17886]
MSLSPHDAVLAVSRQTLERLDTQDAQQVARLWNVFTKCKDALENGHRFENLSWRLWFRQRIPPPTQHERTPPATDAESSKLLQAAPAPLSEPELSTDESTASDDGELGLLHFDFPAASTSPRNAFSAVLHDGVPGDTWDPMHERSASVSGSSLPAPAPPGRRFSSARGGGAGDDDDDRTVQESDSNGAALGTSTPLSTSGTTTPRAVQTRSRSSSISQCHDGGSASNPWVRTGRAESVGPSLSEGFVAERLERDAVVAPGTATDALLAGGGRRRGSNEPRPAADAATASPQHSTGAAPAILALSPALASEPGGEPAAQSPPSAPAAAAAAQTSVPPLARSSRSHLALTAIDEAAESPQPHARHKGMVNSAQTTRQKRASRTHRSHERLAPGMRTSQGNAAQRAQLVHMLSMTAKERAAEEEDGDAEGVADTEREAPGALHGTGPAPKKKTPRKKAPIVFMTGDGADEDEDDVAAAPKAPTAEKRQDAAPAPAADSRVDDSDDDAWASDESDGAEEQRAREARLADERGRYNEAAESERGEMFKKRPIRSVSLADLSLAKAGTGEDATGAAPGTRGLLSSIFHPAEHGAPSRLRAVESSLSVSRRPSPQRASTGDPGAGGRGRPPAGRTLHLSAMPGRPAAPPGSRNTSAPTLEGRVPRSRGVAAPQAPAMNRSKSAIALPLLNLTELRSSTASARADDESVGGATSGASVASPVSRESIDTDAHTESLTYSYADSDSASSIPNRARSSTALQRLSALAQRGGAEPAVAHAPAPEKKKSRFVRSYSAIGSLASLPFEPHAHARAQAPQDARDADEQQGGPSLQVCADQGAPETFARVPQGALPDDWDAASGAGVPGAAAQSRSVPRHATSPAVIDPVPLPSPRTTRQNMLHDELSESVRDNLAWERQSRARILGLASRPQAEAGGSRRPKGPNAPLQTEEESFHHKGW